MRLTFLSGALRSASAFAIILGIAGAAPSHAQTAQRTMYGICSYSLSNVAYLSSTLSLPNNQIGAAGAAFHQYALQHTGATNPHCSWRPSADTLNTELKTLQSRAGTPGWPAKLVNTGWTYQPSATPQATAARTTAAQPAARSAAPATAGTTQNAANGAAQSATNAATGSMGSTMGSAITGAGDSAKQSVESSATGAVTSSVSTATTSATQMVTGGMTSLQNKLFHHGKSAQPAGTAQPAQPAPAAGQPAAATTATATAAPAPAPVPATAAATPATAQKPSIQDEGDGKHSILTLPGDPDAHELTLVSGTKNVYLEESTGDKYIVMPNGQISHIPHKNTAK